MNWTRRIRSLYRREPVTGMLLTAGLVDAVIGGMNSYPMLLAIGLGTMGLAMAMRWKLMQQVRREPMQPQTEYSSKYQSRRSRYLPNSEAHLVTIDVDARKV